MDKQQIPRVTPTMVSGQPDQLSDILNRIIQTVNELQNK